MQRHIGVHMSDEEMKTVEAADEVAFRSPVPTQMVSNGEYNPLPQTEQQRQVEGLIKEMADVQAKRHGMDRRTFLATSAGMATAFAAMNKVFGPVFDVADAEAHDMEMSAYRAGQLANQFIFDDQTHFIRDDFKQEGLVGLTKWAVGAKVNSRINEAPMTLARYKMDNYLKEIFLDSDTKVSLLSGAPFDDPSWWLISNDAIQNACRAVNKLAGGTRMVGHSVITPKYPNWMDEVDRAIDQLKPVSWKSYTIGDPFGPSKYAWRLDDEKLMYPFYEKAVKSGINTICIHKGLMPRDYEKAFAGTWESATVNDLGKAAKDWPQMNFVIYHAAMRPWLADAPDKEMAQFEKDGYIQWATDLARIPEKFGVNNVYAEIGTTFASTCVTNPRFCAAFMGQLVNLMGAERVVWGTDSVWYGSPQWQIEALRRLEIPDDIMKKMKWTTRLGGPNSEVKQKIFGLNSAHLYNLDLRMVQGPAFTSDKLAAIKEEYLRLGGDTGRSNASYGYVAKKDKANA
ncbi:MAG: amidohydrolase family protein [Betaproteobacteria bacterium]|nr:amidohydrolase family protein [Betaproteobacteria bacterium]